MLIIGQNWRAEDETAYKAKVTEVKNTWAAVNKDMVLVTAAKGRAGRIEERWFECKICDPAEEVSQHVKDTQYKFYLDELIHRINIKVSCRGGPSATFCLFSCNQGGVSYIAKT